MKRSHKAGLGFGVASGIITPLGIMIALYSGTRSTAVIIGGILTIAIADALSDSLGIHLSKESDQNYSIKEVWEATITTFVTKFLFATMFVVPFLLFSLKNAVFIGASWGIVLLCIFSYLVAKSRAESPWLAMGEHLSIALLVIVVTYYLPQFVNFLLAA